MKKGLIIVVLASISAIGIGFLGVEAYENAFGSKRGSAEGKFEIKMEREDKEEEEVKGNNEVEVKENNNVSEDVSSQEKAINEENIEGNTLEGAEKLYKKAREAYKREDFIEAERLYKKISNEEFKSQIGEFQYELEDGFKVAQAINEIEKLMAENKYEEAYESWKSITSASVRRLDKQSERLTNFYKTLKEKNVVKGNSFSFEDAKRIYEEQRGKDHGYILIFHSKIINEDGSSSIMMEERHKDYPNSQGAFTIVNENGRILGD